VQVVGATAVVDITDAFLGIGVQEQVAGFAQIVYTLTEIPGVQNVRIQLDGKPASVPRGDGSATTEPLTRDAYAKLAPR
jgi:spore germination protein GerM